MAKKTTSLGTVADINVTPMVDVMLVLLIIFMVVTPMLQKGVSVDMAKAVNTVDMPDADKENAVVLAITRDGKIYLNNDAVAPDQITTDVKDRLSDKLEKVVFLRSDKNAKYSVVAEVVDNIRAAGVDNLGLETDKITERRVPVGPPQ